MKVQCLAEEWYPVFALAPNEPDLPDDDQTIDLSEDEVRDYNDAMRALLRVQRKLVKKLDDARNEVCGEIKEFEP